jgi:hypothetical protein
MATLYNATALENVVLVIASVVATIGYPFRKEWYEVWEPPACVCAVPPADLAAVPNIRRGYFHAQIGWWRQTWNQMALRTLFEPIEKICCPISAVHPII